jgi:hypothetical protein
LRLGNSHDGSDDALDIADAKLAGHKLGKE